jgi:hypothetical protein
MDFSLIFINLLISLLILVLLLFTALDWAGNLFILLLAIAYSFYHNFTNITLQILIFMAIIFIAGELWEFFIGVLGVKRENVSWLTVLIISIGTFIGAIIGTTILPLIGTVLGSALFGGGIAFFIEYLKNKNKKDAFKLAWITFKAQILARFGKIVAGIVMSVLFLANLTW